jgi:AcrR family transcriptional regulator
MTRRIRDMAATRERIVGVMLDLVLTQPYEDITLTVIAEGAGVSHQTVLNHFGSKEGVARAAAVVLAQQTGEARAQAEPGDARGAVAVLVGEYERIGDANVRWGLASERLGSLATLLDEARAGHRAWLERIFGESLPRGRAARARALHALHVATDVNSWKLLRRDLGLSRDAAERVMVDLIGGVLGDSAKLTRARPRRSKG